MTKQPYKQINVVPANVPNILDELHRLASNVKSEPPQADQRREPRNSSVLVIRGK